MKKGKIMLAALGLTLAMSSTALAAWNTGSGTDSGRWWYDLGGGQYYAGEAGQTRWIPKATGAFETRELHVNNQGADIYGVAYIPEGAGERLPLIIMSHGLGGTADSMQAYAEAMAREGYAAYCYDFRGGGERSRSDGATTDMSPLTEVSDLEAVLEAAKTWDFVNTDYIYLMGCSQGGLVSALTAPDHQDEIRAEILFYPAFTAFDMVHENYTSLDQVPDSQWFNWLTLGKRYWVDLWDYDGYAQAERYTGKVLLVQGDADAVVDISYAERLAQGLKHVEYHVIPGAGHGFHGEDFNAAVEYVKDFLRRN